MVALLDIVVFAKAGLVVMADPKQKPRALQIPC
jgi:hypothetical protein